MTEPASWIRLELQRHYPKADYSRGVDLNNNGLLEKNERITDANRNGTIGDHEDWVAFHKRNSAQLKQLRGFFTWSAAFRPNNLIHDVYNYLVHHAPSDYRQRSLTLVHKTYQIITQALGIVKARLASGMTPPPEQKLMIIHSALRASGAVIDFARPFTSFAVQKVGGKWLFSEGSSALAVFAIARELRWPLYLTVIMIGNPYLIPRWDDGRGTSFNYHRMHPASDEKLRLLQKLPKSAVVNGVVLNNLSRRKLLSLAADGYSYHFFKNNQLRKALSLVDTAICLNPNNAFAFFKRGLITSRMKRFADARHSFAKAYKLLQVDPILPSLIGACIDDYAYHDALNHANTFVKHQPHNANGYEFRGTVNLFLGNTTKALRDFTTAINLSPSASVLLLRARMFLERGERSRALADIQHALQLKPTYSRAYSLLGYIHVKHGRHARAFRLFDKAIASAPTTADLYRDRGEAYLELKDYSKALNDFVKAISLDGTNPFYRIGRGEALMGLGRHRRALMDFNHVIKHMPFIPRARAGRGRVYAAMGNRAAAINDFRIAWRNDNKNSAYADRLGIQLLMAGRLREALAVCERAVSHHPNNADLVIMRGIIQHRLGHDHQALRDASRAIVLDPQCARAYYLRAEIRQRRGDMVGALEDLHRAIEIGEPDLGKYYLTRGRLLAAMGVYHRARRDFDKAARSPATHAEARRRIRTLRFVPRLHLDAQSYYALSSTDIPGGRLGFGSTWHLLNPYRSLSLGLWINAGLYGLSGLAATDISGGISLINEFRRSRLHIETGAGFVIHLGGNNNSSPLRQAAFARHGIRYSIKASKRIDVGATLALQHEIRHPRHTALLPGLELTMHLW